MNRFSDHLLGGDSADDPASLLHGRCLDLAVFFQTRDDVLDHLASFFDMDDLTSSEHNGDLNFVFAFQEALGLLHLEFDIVLASLRTKSNLFCFCVVRFSRVLFLALLILEFAVVHNSANGWFLVRSNFDEIQPAVASSRECVFRRDDSQLFPSFTNDSDWRNTNLVVYSDVFAVDLFVLSKACRISTRMQRCAAYGKYRQ